MILFVGSYGTGITLRVPRVPQAGETLSGSELAIGFGGKSSNQAVAAARNGAQVEIITALGNDAFAQQAQELWDAEGITHRNVKLDGSASTMAGVIMVEPDGENRIAIAPGALNNLSPQDLQERKESFENAKLVVICLEIPQETAEYAVTLAHQVGAKVILNTAPAGPVSADVLSLVDFVIPNQTEFAFLVEQGWEPSPRQHLIVTKGGDGSEILFQGQSTVVAPNRQNNVVDTTGAGDTYVGVFAAALSQEKTIVEAVQLATVASSITVTQHEVIPAIPHKDVVATELEKYLNGAAHEHSNN